MCPAIGAPQAGQAQAAKGEEHGRPVVEPQIAYANLMVPGQELAVHTDVPEFRGVSRKTHPQWLCVAMHHSGLFDDWRMPIATGVAWFHDCDGGDDESQPRLRQTNHDELPKVPRATVSDEKVLMKA